MPKLPSFTPKQIIDILVDNGFALDRTSGSHHIYRNPNTGKIVVVPYHFVS